MPPKRWRYRLIRKEIPTTRHIELYELISQTRIREGAKWVGRWAKDLINHISACLMYDLIYISCIFESNDVKYNNVRPTPFCWVWNNGSIKLCDFHRRRFSSDSTISWLMHSHNIPTSPKPWQISEMKKNH